MNYPFKRRNLLIRLYITGFIVLPITISGYSQENSITGTWKTDYAAIVSEMSPEKKGKYDQLPQEVKERAGKSLNNRTYEFFEDGVTTAFWSYEGREISYTGTWEITTDGNLSVKIGENVTVYEMVFKNASKVVLLPIDKQKGLLFNTLVLNRV